MDSLVAYLVAAMVGWVPVYAQPDHETRDEVIDRYESIARDAATVALDPDETPLFDGPDGRARTALLMLSVASFESGYRKRVDDGRGRGDNGHSFCLMQIRVGTGATREGWTGPDLVEDRTRCFRAALHILRTSFGICHSAPLEDRLSAYASGSCTAGTEASKKRILRARNWSATHEVPRIGPTDS
jgi:hypothetical protein